MKSTYLILLGFFLITGLHTYSQQQLLIGRVTDTAGKPLAFATIKVKNPEMTLATANNGSFRFTVPATITEVELAVSYVGKQSTTITVQRPFPNVHIRLKELSLSLNEVQVSATRSKVSSPSSIVFNRETIDQLQAFSLADVLNHLPGKTTTAPQLQSPTTLTLRDVSAGNAALNNSLGAAIIMDGLRISNDANMQSRSVSMRGMSASVISSRQDGSFDVPFTGIDLRDIATDQIESIEVVTGVAPAQYGELTSGAVIINRQAGRSKFNFNTRLNGGSTEFSLSKGFSLGKKLGALNVNASYLNSNKDPRDKIKTFNRVSTGIMWTTYITPAVKNTFSFDFNTKLDDVKEDPDDDSRLKTYSKSRGISISNRTAVTLKSSFFQRINFNAGYSHGYQDTYNQWLLNGPPKGLANKDTTGVYEGIFLPGAYLAEERVIGEPVSFNGNLSTTASFAMAGLQHQLSMGADVSYSDNIGAGIITDPERPRWINVNHQNTRPVNYEQLLPALVNTGIYLQDNITATIAGRSLQAGLGVRYNNQNGSSNIQPRINISYALSKKLEWSVSYGISTKSPTLAHRYPAPAWLDIPLLNLYTGYANQSLFLVYTKKITPDNSNLKPARSTQLETGLRYKTGFITTSVFAYAKFDSDGFNSYNKFEPITLPEYAYNYNAGQPITYYPTGNEVTYSASSLYVITNGMQSDNYGFEWMVQTRKIRAIETSIAASTAFNYSSYRSGGDMRTIRVDQSYIDAGKTAWYGVYHPSVGANWSVISKINTDTHLPKLGFVVSLSADVFWGKENKTTTASNQPVGYLDKELRYFPLDKFDPASTEYGHLKLDDFTGTLNRQPMVYANLNMRIAKEIRDNLRMSLNIYNVFNMLPEHYDPARQTYNRFNSPVSITAGIQLKF